MKITNNCAIQFAYISVFIVLVIARNTKFTKLTADNKKGFMQLKHGAFKCLGALISKTDILTCCTCVSEMTFLGDCAGEDAIGYEMKPVEPANVTITTPEFTFAKTQEVIIHPQCDVDGTYDYAIVKIGPKIKSGIQDAIEDAQWSTDRIVNRMRMFSMNAKEITKKLSKNGACCQLHTIFNNDPLGRPTMISTKMTDKHFCWNGSETKPIFESKYCIRSSDERPISDAKSGSPVYCEGKLVGILARRFALGGRQYCSVNGLDGAIEFIKDVLHVNMGTDKAEEEERIDGRMNERIKRTVYLNWDSMN